MMDNLISRVGLETGRTILASIFIAGSLWNFSSAALAETQVTVQTDRAKIIRLATDPSTIIVGNPIFADVTVRDKLLIIQGKHFGSTNVIVMDDESNVIADMEVTVIADVRSQTLTVYRQGKQESYDCTTTCESYIRVGDSNEYMDTVTKQVKSKSSSSE